VAVEEVAERVEDEEREVPVRVPVAVEEPELEGVRVGCGAPEKREADW
jgi:hypothetical protein